MHQETSVPLKCMDGYNVYDTSTQALTAQRTAIHYGLRSQIL